MRLNIFTSTLGYIDNNIDIANKQFAPIECWPISWKTETEIGSQILQNVILKHEMYLLQQVLGDECCAKFLFNVRTGHISQIFPLQEDTICQSKSKCIAASTAV